MQELNCDVKKIKLKNHNESGCIEVFDFFGNKIKSVEFINSKGFITMDVPVGEFYFFLRGNLSLLYTKIKVTEDGEFNLRELY